MIILYFDLKDDPGHESGRIRYTKLSSYYHYSVYARYPTRVLVEIGNVKEQRAVFCSDALFLPCQPTP